MIKNKLIFTIIAAVLLIHSCSEENLELTNPNQLSPESFFKTEAQVQSAVNAAYANLQTRGLYSRHMFFMMDNMSHENAGNPQLEADKKVYLDFSFDSSHGPIADYWESCFRGINKANFVIGNSEAINEIPDSFLSPEKKKKFIAEAKFLRGLYYFLLTTRFGDLPLITVIPEGGAGFPMSPQSAVYAQIVKDLTEASSELLDSDENGRAHKKAAMAILGKVLLFQKDYSGAMGQFSSIYGEYTLEEDFFDNFKLEEEHGKESIFEIEFDAALGAGAMWNSTVSGAGPNEVTFRGQEYGFLNWFNVYPSDDLLDEYEAGDKRYAGTFYSVGDTYALDTETVTAENLTSGSGQKRAGWKKYQNYYRDKSEVPESSINFKYIRYADVLLMMAECANETSGPGDAIGYINEVRSRAGLPALAAGLSKDEVFNAIVHERKVELAGEQSRFNDIMRWGNASTELSGTNFQAGKNELLPIPDREISSNEAIGPDDQNPGF